MKSEYTLVAVLPSGEWSEVASRDDVSFVMLTHKQMDKVRDFSENNMLELAACKTRAEINALVGD